MKKFERLDTNNQSIGKDFKQYQAEAKNTMTKKETTKPVQHFDCAHLLMMKRVYPENSVD